MTTGQIQPSGIAEKLQAVIHKVLLHVAEAMAKPDTRKTNATKQGGDPRQKMAVNARLKINVETVRPKRWKIKSANGRDKRADDSKDKRFGEGYFQVRRAY